MAMKRLTRVKCGGKHSICVRFHSGLHAESGGFDCRSNSGCLARPQDLTEAVRRTLFSTCAADTVVGAYLRIMLRR